MEKQPSQDQLMKLYEQYQRKKQYNAEYMKKFRQEHKEEWNKQQRERYAKKKAQKLLKDNSHNNE